mgnify:CR=1 FL=1
MVILTFNYYNNSIRSEKLFGNDKDITLFSPLVCHLWEWIPNWRGKEED